MDVIEDNKLRGHDIPVDTKVLYIEDNRDNMLVMEILLNRSLGLSILRAENAEDGLAICRNNPPQAILMDIRLPGMGGIEAIKRLKDSPDTRDIPIIAVSADAMQGDIREVMNAGAFEYITKPFDLDEVVASLTRALKENH